MKKWHQNLIKRSIDGEIVWNKEAVIGVFGYLGRKAYGVQDVWDNH